MMTHFLLTGGAGFRRSNLVDRLLAEGQMVTVLDNFDPFYGRAHKDANLEQARHLPKFRLVEGDLNDPQALDQAWAEGPPEVVVHLAAKAGVRPSIQDPV